MPMMSDICGVVVCACRVYWNVATAIATYGVMIQVEFHMSATWDSDGLKPHMLAKFERHRASRQSTKASQGEGKLQVSE